MKKSIDKCAGDDCACKLAKPIRIFRDLKIESISIDHGPSIFPGVDPPSMAMAVRNIDELRERRRRAR